MGTSNNIRSIKKSISNLIDTVECINADIEELQTELEDIRDNIEPYEGKDDLTEGQQVKIDWLEEVISTLQELGDEIESGCQTLGEYID